ncbi:hypothetical protein DY000_02060794 [Brassica cretica]|uniref:Uncharacterized protein n=1 Tax=Brassica cretica TaxID=69181 RepID=A0ABQ7B0Q9_BRACR|nr:hypothetical protein DY000_02060794 [Brassica cretica]
MSDEGCRSTEGLCCRSTGVSENWSTGLVSGSTVVEQNRATRKCCCRSIGSALPCGSCVPNLQDLHQAQGLQPPEHLFSDLLNYADDPPGHAGLHCCPEQVSKAQPCLTAQYRSMSEMECRSMSDEGCRSMEGLCCRSTGVSENRSTGLVSGSTVVEQNRATRKCCCRSIGSALPCGSCVPNLQDLHQAQGLQPPEHIFSALLHYADDPHGHAGLHCCPEQVSKAQPCIAAQYRSMFEMECRSTSGEGCRLTESLCCRSTGVSENRSTGLVSGSTVVEQNRATRKCCCRSIGSAPPCGSCVPNLQDLVRILVEFPCCF